MVWSSTSGTVMRRSSSSSRARISSSLMCSWPCVLVLVLVVVTFVAHPVASPHGTASAVPDSA